ncbi:MAG: MFS transporter [Actinobacteria bacterium]|nr:MFS transporter [Actinomycetota bacterium]
MLFRRAHDPQADEATDAILDGDRVLRVGTAQAALRHRDFRLVWGGTFASNIGTWMQNVLLGAFAYELTHDAGFVGLVYFAQLGPLLVLAPLGGVIADAVDRRRYLVLMQLLQLVLSLGLAGIAAADRPSETAMFLCVLAIGVANALSVPALGAILPTLVPRDDLSGAVSLQSVQMNLSRVIGPAIGAPLYTTFGAAPVFAINAVTYLFAVAGLLLARYATRNPEPMDGSPVEKLLSGFRVASHDPLIRRVLVTMTTFSFFSLMFVGLMPEIAATNLDIAPKSVAYGILYGLFGLGATLGAITVGTYLAHHSRAMIVRCSLVAFAVLLVVFALLRTEVHAYVVVTMLGFAYFLVITSLATVLQEHLDDAVRGRVMALWIMSFGGTVPIGVLVGGFVVDQLATITVVVLLGALVALALAAYCDLRRVGVS